MPNFHKRTGKSIQQAFLDHHAKNPKLYDLFKKFALQIVEKRKNKPNKKTSAKLIINRIRWELYVGNIIDDGYRINDAWSSRYARMFMEEFPEYANIFNCRNLRAE